MDARARSPRGAHKVAIGGSKEGRWRGWRAEVVVAVGLLGALTLLVVVFDGSTGSLTAFSSPGIELVRKAGKVVLLLQMNMLFMVRSHVQSSDAN
ncbi:unnamed protein product [Urochloa humidicola]